MNCEKSLARSLSIGMEEIPHDAEIDTFEGALKLRSSAKPTVFILKSADNPPL